MKKIIIVLIVCFSFPVACFASTPQEVAEQAWQGRREIGTEQTLWRVQDYVQLQHCEEGVSNITCYKKTGKEKHLAQSLKFDQGGHDGAWVHFFAPKSVKNKGAVTYINDLSNIAESPRFFCRGRLARTGARRITTPVSQQKAIDAKTNLSWAMMLMQTGVQIITKDSFSYSFDDDNNIMAYSNNELPSHRLYIGEGNVIIRMDFLDEDGHTKWIVKNQSIVKVDDHWYAKTVFVVDVVKGTASLMTRDNSLSFKSWPSSYNKRSLPCGR